MENKKDLIKELKSWAKWGLFIGLFNFLVCLLAVGIISEESSLIKFNAPIELLYITIALSFLIVVISIICLVTKEPWLGYYFFYGIYLLYIGVFNIGYSDNIFYIIISILLVLGGIYGLYTGVRYFRKEEKVSDDIVEKKPLPPKALLFLLYGIIFPGGGHFMLKKRKRSIIFSSILVGLFILGLLLDGHLYRIGIDTGILAILASIGSMALGLPYFIALIFSLGAGNLASVNEIYGSYFLLAAGLMNILVSLDAMDIAAGRKD